MRIPHFSILRDHYQRDSSRADWRIGVSFFGVYGRKEKRRFVHFCATMASLVADRLESAARYLTIGRLIMSVKDNVEGAFLGSEEKLPQHCGFASCSHHYT